MEKIVEAINKAGSFLLCMHVDPDGDTIGSASALSSMLEKLGKNISIYCSGRIPEVYKFLKYSDKVSSSIDDSARFDAIIALDCADSKRIPGFDRIEKLSDLVINIDHHVDNTKFGDINFIKKCSSTGELIYNLSKKLGIELDADMATSIYSAIVTDTGNFKYDNATAKVFKIAAALVEAGADPHDIAIKIYESKTRSEMKILAKALGKAETILDGQVAYTWLTKSEIESTGALDEEMSSIADRIRALKGVDIAVFLREMSDGKVKVNLRSKQRNIQMVAKELGGGGHQRASGVVMEGPVEEARDKLLAAIKDKWTQL